MIQNFVHYFLHLIFPVLIALTFFRNDWKKTYLILLLTMLVDLDHLVADPMFQADRCGIGYHPLHSFYAIGFYFLLLFFPKPWRIIAIGLLFHMLTDLIDCMFMYSRCSACYENAPAYEVMQAIGSLLGK